MIKRDMSIEDLVEQYPELIVPLRQYGVICIGCGEPVWGTLGELMDKKELNNQDDIIAKMNSIINKE